MSLPPPLSLYEAATQNLCWAMESSYKPDCWNRLEAIHGDLLSIFEQYVLARRVEKAKFYSRKVLSSCRKYEEAFRSWQHRPSSEVLWRLQTRLEKMQMNLNQCEIYLRTHRLKEELLWYLEQAQMWAEDPGQYSEQDGHLIFREMSASLDAYAKQRIFNLGIELEAEALMADSRICQDLKESWDKVPYLEHLFEMRRRLSCMRIRIERCEECLATQNLYKEALSCIHQAMRWVQHNANSQVILQEVVSLVGPSLEEYAKKRATQFIHSESLQGILNPYQKWVEWQYSLNAPPETSQLLETDLERVKKSLVSCEREIRMRLYSKPLRDPFRNSFRV